VTSPLRIGTRGSDLALWQAQRVAALLHESSGLFTELVIVHTSGDRDRSRALHELPGVGFFAKELQGALLGGEVDLVVHSLKDLPIEEPEGLRLAAVLLRQDPRDLLLTTMEALGDGLFGLRPGARLGTSSLRRSAQALALQPDLRIVPLRGNVPTRVRRLRDGDVDAILLAAAGLDRLGLDIGGLSVRRLDVEAFLPAPGQGALAVEVREGDAAGEVVGSLDEPAVAEATACERAVLKGLGGGCHLPLGAYAHREDGVLRLDAVLGELDAGVTRAVLRRASVRGRDGGELASRALEKLRNGGAGA
jgi:hydroxymethylbilane synthase